MHLFRRHRCLFLILSAASFSTISPVFARAPDSPPHVQVSLFNDAPVGPDILTQARARATAVFAQAGVEVDWLVCAPPDPSDFRPSYSVCSGVAWPTHLSVRIISRGAKVSEDVFGQAFVDDSGHGIYSNVYYQNLVLSANHPGLSAGEMLGYVLAHEIGHLLLGTNSHSSDGIMQARWRSPVVDAAAHASLFFTPSQIATLRSRLSDVPTLSARTVRNRISSNQRFSCIRPD